MMGMSALTWVAGSELQIFLQELLAFKDRAAWPRQLIGGA